MDEFFLKIYRDQILDQIESAELSYTLVTSPNIDIDSLFVNIYHFIVHASNVVKLIKPKISGDIDFKNYRMKNLQRKYPKLPDIDPALLHIRNDFEHFDERIDNWVISSQQHNYADKNIGDINAIKGLSPKDNFRWYDPVTKTLYFCGAEYPLEKLYQYIQAVKGAL